MPDTEREQVSEIMSLTEAEARGYPTIDTHACFRNFPTIFRALIRQKHANPEWPKTAVYPPFAEAARVPDRIDVKQLK